MSDVLTTAYLLDCGHVDTVPGPCGATTGRAWCCECGEGRAVVGEMTEHPNTEQQERDHIARIWRGEEVGVTETMARQQLAEHRQTLADLNAGRIKPSRVVGNVRRPMTNARDWLGRMIEQCEQAIETEGQSHPINQSNARYAVMRQVGVR